MVIQILELLYFLKNQYENKSYEMITTTCINRSDFMFTKFYIHFIYKNI